MNVPGWEVGRRFPPEVESLLVAVFGAILEDAVGAEAYARRSLERLSITIVDEDDGTMSMQILTGIGNDVRYSTDGTVYSTFVNVADAARHVAVNWDL